MQVKVLKSFHFSFNGIETVLLQPGETHDMAPQFVKGLRELGVIEVEEAAVDAPSETASKKEDKSNAPPSGMGHATKGASEEKSKSKEPEPRPGTKR